MPSYEPPVSQLIELGQPHSSRNWAEYSQCGIGPEHVPELIRLLQDDELARSNSESKVVFAQLHAWRALGQLRAEAAIEPLLDLLDQIEDDERWDDWTVAEVPIVLGMIGPAAFPATVARLKQSRRLENSPRCFSDVLKHLAERHPELRVDAVSVLASSLENAAENHPSTNGSFIANLLDLNAVESWPVIEKAFATGNVDAWVAGDAAFVKWELGLGPRPTDTRVGGFFRASPTPLPPTGPTAKDRAEKRAKQRKAEKRKSKRSR